jgi:CheY-like chemotaxis protein
LIDDILDLSKVESGRIEVEKMTFSLSELISETISVLGPQASKKGLRLNVEREKSLADTIQSDPIRLKQIFMNIVGNAVKFTSFGSVDVRLKSRANKENELRRTLIIEVEDSGIGISEAQQARLFQPFTQADSSTTRKFGGTGLGLVLSRQLARLLGGDLRLKWSLPRGGSCFVIEVHIELVKPLRPMDSDEILTICESQMVRASHSLALKGARILVVDDSLDNQMLIGRTLRLLGATVELAGDGMEAIEKAMSQTFDVVLMDLQMPRLGGVEATRLLRRRGYTRPIVALTAHALKEDRALCMDVGCTDYLTKPIERDNLLRVLERLSTSAG